MLRFLVRVLGAPLRAHHPLQHADAIVVLGTPLDPQGALTAIGEERVRAGAKAWHEGIAPRLVLTGGRAPFARQPAGASEAAAMADYARELGVPDDVLVVEDASSSTFENARECARLLLPRGAKKVWIVSHPFHLRRAMRQFRRAGFEPLGWLIAGSLEETLPWWGLRRVLREYVSWAKALLRG